MDTAYWAHTHTILLENLFSSVSLVYSFLNISFLLLPIFSSQPDINFSLIDPPLWLLTGSWHMVMWDLLEVNPLSHHTHGELVGSRVREWDDVIFTSHMSSVKYLHHTNWIITLYGLVLVKILNHSSSLVWNEMYENVEN